MSSPPAVTTLHVTDYIKGIAVTMVGMFISAIDIAHASGSKGDICWSDQPIAVWF
jgi:hypothetical protein